MKKLQMEYLALEIKLKKRQIKESKEEVRTKRIYYKTALLDLWRTMAIAKTIDFKDFEDMKKMEEKFKKPKDRIHI